MATQTATRQTTGGDDGGYVEVDVTTHRRYLGKIKVKKHAKVEEVLEKIREKCKEEGIDFNKFSEWTIEINGRKINFDKDGKIKESDNIEITENAVLVATQKMVGGA